MKRVLTLFWISFFVCLGQKSKANKNEAFSGVKKKKKLSWCGEEEEGFFFFFFFSNEGETCEEV
jgi:hypothetical protein